MRSHGSASSMMLVCHPKTDNQAVHGIEALVRTVSGKTLYVSYVLQGNLERVQIPAFRSLQKADRLWQHTCFEAFLRSNEGPSYYEFNFSPSGEWAAYFFAGYRSPGPPLSEDFSPSVTVRREKGLLVLDATIDLNRLGKIDTGAIMRVALSAVIEDDQGGLSYWALKHPAGKPDFHHRDTFILEIKSTRSPER